MSFRNYLKQLSQNDSLTQISKPVSKRLQAAGILKALEPSPVLFSNITESAFDVIGNLLCSKQTFADYLGIPTQQIIPILTNAIENPTRPQIINARLTNNKKKFITGIKMNSGTTPKNRNIDKRVTGWNWYKGDDIGTCPSNVLRDLATRTVWLLDSLIADVVIVSLRKGGWSKCSPSAPNLMLED